MRNRGRGGGGFPRRRRGRGTGRRGNVCGEGGGAKYFFSGPKCPPRNVIICVGKVTMLGANLSVRFFFGGARFRN